MVNLNLTEHLIERYTEGGWGEFYLKMLAIYTANMQAIVEAWKAMSLGQYAPIHYKFVAF